MAIRLCASVVHKLNVKYATCLYVYAYMPIHTWQMLVCLYAYLLAYMPRQTFVSMNIRQKHRLIYLYTHMLSTHACKPTRLHTHTLVGFSTRLYAYMCIYMPAYILRQTYITINIRCPWHISRVVVGQLMLQTFGSLSC